MCVKRTFIRAGNTFAKIYIQVVKTSNLVYYTCLYLDGPKFRHTAFYFARN